MTRPDVGLAMPVGSPAHEPRCGRCGHEAYTHIETVLPVVYPAWRRCDAGDCTCLAWTPPPSAELPEPGARWDETEERWEA